MPSQYQLVEDLNRHPVYFRGGSSDLISKLIKGLVSSLANHPSDRLSRFIGKMLGGSQDRWIQRAVTHRGALSAEALRHGFTKASVFAKHVIANPDQFDRKTLKRAYLALTLSKLKRKGGEISPDEEAYGHELKAPPAEHESSGRLKVFIEDIPDYAPPSVRKFLAEYGTATILKAKMCRVAVKQQAIISLGNIVTLGELERKRKDLQKVFGSKYDDVFHLYIVVQVRTKGGEILEFKIEKNEKAQVSRTSYNDQKDFRGNTAAELNQPPTRVVTLIEMFKRADKAVGGKALWEYNLAHSNCQAFVIALLGSGNGMLTPAGRDFALQDVKYLIPDWIAKVAKKGTDFGNKVKSFLFGKGL